MWHVHILGIPPCTWIRKLCCALFCLLSAALVFPLIFCSLTHSENPNFIEIVACVSISTPNFRAVFEETAVSGLICVGSMSCDSGLPQWKNRLGLKQSVGCSALCQLRGVSKGTSHRVWPCPVTVGWCCRERVTGCQEGSGLGDPSKRTHTSNCHRHASQQQEGCQA